MKDILTPRERFGLLVIDENPDRCCVIPLVTSHAASIAGISLKDYYTNGTSMARAQLAALNEYQYDAVSFFSEVGILAEAMGSEFTYPHTDLPVLKVPALSKKAISELPIPDPRNAYRLPVYLEAIEYAYGAVGDRVPILAYVPAPFTTGMMLSQPDIFLMQTIKKPQLIHEIMEISLKAAMAFCFHIINAGGLPVIVDPLASSSVISPTSFEEFALPYEQRLIDYLHRYDLDIILHICGDTSPIINLLPLTNADLISIDRVDLGLVKREISDKVRLVGNFNTSKIAFSSPGEIYKEVQTMVTCGKQSLKGYIVSTGCEVPIRTPKENVKAFIKAARENAWYWD
ncbi:uroporphyrinogen decarboxylase family protein [candidate division WOR-3 bacterium]|nr:uroporphyrinogen decarboxylase family protein [candidate division WOR-3 bacterium]